MTVFQFLKKPKYLRAKAEALTEKYHALEARATGAGVNYSRIRSNTGSITSLDDIVIKMAELSTRIIDLKAEALESKFMIMDALEHVPPDSAAAMSEFYICNKMLTEARKRKIMAGIPALTKYLREQGIVDE